MNYQRIVIKLGTSTLTAGTSYLSLPRMVDLVRQMSQLHSDHIDVILVSSGAMAAGREALDFPQLPKQIPAKQMLAAIGQPRLMSIYSQLFGFYSLTVAQLLLTRADLADRGRYINARNTIQALLEKRAVPIINENDTVATEEIRVGDNDNLSALVANLIDADLLIMLTDQEGLFTADPRYNPNAELIGEVRTADIPDSLWQAAGGSKGNLGTGGMITKLQAADLARRSGTAVVIARGSDADILLRAARGEAVGTRFSEATSALESRKRYILSGGKTGGMIVVDTGAVSALRSGGSLLPVGVRQVKGNFERGDTIKILDETGDEIGQGMSNYAAGDLQRIMGLHSTEIQNRLGYNFGDEVIHRNDMVLR